MNRLDGVADKMALATGPTTVKAALTDRYGTDAPAVATSIVARVGAGTLQVKDTRGNTLETITLDATGATAPREFVFQVTEIVALAGGLTSVEVYA